MNNPDIDNAVSATKTLDDRFAFTLSRPSKNWEEEVFKDFVDTFPSIQLRYLVYSLEKGPDSGVPHIQGYFELNSPTNYWAVKSRLPSTYYVQVAREDRMTNYHYCSKESTPVELMNYLGDLIELSNPSEPKRLYLLHRSTKSRLEMLNSELHWLESRILEHENSYPPTSPYQKLDR